MDVDIRVEGEQDPRALEELGRFLRSERTLTGRVKLARRPVIEGELGAGAFELVSVALGSGGAVSVLAGALNTWLGARRGTISLTVDGNSVTVPQGTPVEEIERLVRLLERREVPDGR